MADEQAEEEEALLPGSGVTNSTGSQVSKTSSSRISNSSASRISDWASSNSPNSIGSRFSDWSSNFSRLTEGWSPNLLKYQIPKSVRKKVCIFIFILVVCLTLLVYSCLSCSVNCGSICKFANIKPVLSLADGRNFTHNSSSNGHYPHMERRLPQCIIIGIRKAGTRALLEYLNIHPDVVITSKEQHFFNTKERYELGLEYYRKQMPYSFKHQITVEKTPAYFTDMMTPERIYRMNSSIQLLLIVRDPVVRLVSDYTQLMYRKEERNKEIIPLEHLVINADGEININYKPIQRSIYYKFFGNWLDFFQRDQIHIVNGDALITNPYPELYKIESFLRLEHRISKNKFYFNASKGFFCVDLPELENSCLGESKGRPHPVIESDVMAKLYEFYRPKNELFFKLAGVEFKWP